MTAKISASADGLKVTIGNAAEDALEINQTAKTIKGINGYLMAGNGPAFRAFREGTVNSIGTAWTKIVFNAEEFDTNNNYDPVTGRFTPTVAGYYQVGMRASCPVTANTHAILAGIYKNGVGAAFGGTSVGQTTLSAASNVDALIYMNGTTDYIEGWMISSVATSTNTGSPTTYFSASLVRAA